MMKRLTIASLALLSMTPAWAQVGGSYRSTCEVIRQNGPVLVAECQTRYGETRTSSIDIRGCRGGDIANLNGRLTCSGRGGFGDSPERVYRDHPRPRFYGDQNGYSDD